MIKLTKKNIRLQIKKNKKIYFAGDFHFGRPNKDDSQLREKKVINWLNSISSDAQDVFLLGDLFDFWFEYNNVIPKENLRFLAKISDMIDKGINFHYFLGNHDMWALNYFSELGIKVYNDPEEFIIGDKTILVGHGDGIGVGDFGYKVLKKVFFRNKIFEYLYRWIHPDIGIPLGRYFSGTKKAMDVNENAETNDKRIVNYCKDYYKYRKVNVFIFGHSHFKNKCTIAEDSVYYNCGEWINGSSYLEYDSKKFQLLDFKN